MRNLTVSLSDAVLDRLRVLAAEKKVSVNRYVGEVLREVTEIPNKDWIAQHRALHDEIGPHYSEGPWTRDEIYAERLS